MKTIYKLMLACLFAAVVIGGCKKQLPPQQPPEPKVQQEETSNATAPDFTLTDQNGKTHSLSDYKGKIVVLAWINPDCPFIKRHYDAGTFDMADEYMGKGVVWLAINSTHYFDVAKNLEFAKERGVDYPVLDDKSGDVGHLYKARTTPHMFIVGKDGQLVYQGAIDDDPKGDKAETVNYVKQALDELLAGQEVSMPQIEPYGCSVKYAG